MPITNYQTLALYKRSTKGYLFATAGTYTQTLRTGTYAVKIHGAGGAGGESPSGSGGAGGVGQYKVDTFVITSPVQATVVVGAGGLTYQNGGNGGARGVSGGWGDSYQSGAGGGAGHTSYISFVSANGEQVLYALGGGGGGGGGRTSTPSGRYASGGAGGGGGGYYRFDPATKTEEDVPGQRGANGAAGHSYASGGNGLTGNTTDFPTLRSGSAGAGTESGPGSNAAGGGASGAGGGEGGNHTSGYGGGGGGGAGGDMDAGGGNGASNAHTVPTASIDNEGNTVTSGWGIGGAPEQNGTDGWVFIIRTGAAQTI